MKLTAPQKKALTRIQEFPLIADRGGYHLTNGETVHAGVVERLIAKGALRPSQDGLLEGFTQTYVVAS